MARTVAELPSGTRITDYISLGVVTKTFPLDTIQTVLRDTERASVRHRDLPAHVTVYYVIALALYMRASYREILRCLTEGLQWLGPDVTLKVTGKSGISQARTRLGWQPVKQLHDEIVKPIATESTRGAWYKKNGALSVSMAAHWMWLMKKKTNKFLDDLPPVGATAPFPSYGSYPWWKMEPMSCLGQKWVVSAQEKLL